MSFGFPRQTQELECVHQAILSAYRQNILLFAAARNNGALQKVAYPADQPEVICVYSADGEGNGSHFNPSPENNMALSVVGEAVESSWLENKTVRESGTSSATPIAAGIAGILMDYLLFVRKGNWTEEHTFIANKIKRPHGMLKVMKSHLCTERQGFHFLTPWELFCKEKKDRIAEVLLETLSKT
jgi:Subtilase family